MKHSSSRITRNSAIFMGDRGVFCLIIISLEEFCEIKQHACSLTNNTCPRKCDTCSCGIIYLASNKFLLPSCDVNIFCASEEFVGTKKFSEDY